MLFKFVQRQLAKFSGAVQGKRVVLHLPGEDATTLRRPCSAKPCLFFLKSRYSANGCCPRRIPPSGAPLVEQDVANPRFSAMLQTKKIGVNFRPRRLNGLIFYILNPGFLVSVKRIGSRGRLGGMHGSGRKRVQAVSMAGNFPNEAGIKGSSSRRG